MKKMNEIKSFRDLQVWQLSKEIAKDIYLYTQQFPRQETYGLVQQVRRAAISIPSNIAEGHARASRKEFLHFLSIAIGSLAEVETQIELSIDLGYLGASDMVLLNQKMNQLGRMIRALTVSLKNQSPVPSLQPL